jgi:hypothetical protein
MKSKRSRLALSGALALVVALTAGLTLGSVADAKKKKGKKGASSVTVSRTAPTVIPPTPDGPGTKTSLVPIPLAVGKKAKGKVVGADSVAVTYSFTGMPPVPPDGGSLYETTLSLTAPNGRTVRLDPPGFNDPNTSATGPTTETATSPFFECELGPQFPTPQPDVCDASGQQDPQATLVPPAYVGTKGDNNLALFAGVSARGTWTVSARNFGTPDRGPSTLTSISLRIPLVSAPSGKK